MKNNQNIAFQGYDVDSFDKRIKRLKKLKVIKISNSGKKVHQAKQDFCYFFQKLEKIKNLSEYGNQ